MKFVSRAHALSGSLLLLLSVAATLGACGSTRTDDTAGSPRFGSADGGPANNDAPRPCDSVVCAAAGGTCQSNECRIAENEGNVPPDVQASLRNGGNADTAFRWLYPYDKTVFPRGLLPPLLQLDGDDADAIYVHVEFTGLAYDGFFGKAAPPRARFSRAVWDAITIAAGPKAQVKVSATKISAGKVTGPISETWTIAQGNLAGTIYHETYNSKLIGGPPMQSPIGPIASGVGIMKIEPGASGPTILKKGCANTCHTASADGSTLVASVEIVNDKTYNSSSAAYDLRNGAVTIATSGTQAFTYGALTPDGTLSLSATDYRTAATDLTTIPSALYDTHTGKKVTAKGWDGVIKRSGTPAFSPDGRHVAFAHSDTHPSADTLATMDFDQPSRTFSNVVDVATHAKQFVGWPAFTPDSRQIVYHVGSTLWLETNGNNTGDIFFVNRSTSDVRRLDALDGYVAAGTNDSYLPANDPKLNFSPTVLPVAVGGYFWAVFTSHRSYGNTLASKVGNNEYGKLWVAAIDIDSPDGVDPSHPAFYLDGQELEANNLRGFWVLSPCKSNGATCNGGAECCEGFCRGESGAAVCVGAPAGCSNEYEKCGTAGDCCGTGAVCINARCAFRGPK